MRMRRLNSTTSTDKVNNGDNNNDNGKSRGADDSPVEIGPPGDDEGCIVGGCTGNDNHAGNLKPQQQWVRVCAASDVEHDGQMYRFEDDQNLILVARHNGVVRATDLICTHADADLSTGFLGPDGIRCPLHLSVFGLEDGMPKNPPAERPLRVYNVKIDDSGVYVGV